MKRMLATLRWRIKQRLAGPSRYYGDGGTLHHSGYLDVETHNGTVVAVWFRCQVLPFKQTEVGTDRASVMEDMSSAPGITGVEVSR